MLMAFPCLAFSIEKAFSASSLAAALRTGISSLPALKDKKEQKKLCFTMCALGFSLPCDQLGKPKVP
jgi:hypothetical protein